MYIIMLRMALFLSLLFFMTAGSLASDILLNGSTVYLTTGEWYGLYQGYILKLKSVSGDGSVWLDLTLEDKIVKSDIARKEADFVYNKTNRSIIIVKVKNVYSGSSEQNLVSLSLYQYADPDLPAPKVTERMPEDTRSPSGNSSAVRIHTPAEPLIWTLGIIFILILFYVLRKLW